jgi:hypothetical protein
MHPDSRFRPASSEIVHDIIDDQVVVVRLDTGVYYSLAGVAALVWTGLSRGATLAQVRASLRERFPEADDIDSSLKGFVAELEVEGLIAPDDRPAGLGREEIAAVPTRPTLPKAFEAPRLEKYTDMQQLLLIDPIHEADERGWPHPVPDRPPG